MDHLTDNSGKLIYQLTKEANIPEYVYDHTLDDKDELPDSYFADSVHRLYPIHSKADTFLSAALSMKTAGDLRPDVKQVLNEAVELWGVKDDLNEAFSQNKTASEEPSGVKINYTDGEKVYHTTHINTPEDFSKVAWDIMNAEKYPLSIRKETCRELLNKAGHLAGKDIKELEKTAGYGTGMAYNVQDHVRNRSLLLRSTEPELSKKLNNLADKIAEVYEYIVPKEALTKTAAFVDLVDRATGLHHQYSKGLERPEDVYKYTVSDGRVLKKYAVNMRNDQVLTSYDIENNFPSIQRLMDEAFDCPVSNVKEAVEKLTDLDSVAADLVVRTIHGE